MRVFNFLRDWRESAHLWTFQSRMRILSYASVKASGQVRKTLLNQLIQKVETIPPFCSESHGLPVCQWRTVSAWGPVPVGAPLPLDSLCSLLFSGIRAEWLSHSSQWKHWRWRGRLVLLGWRWAWVWCVEDGEFPGPSCWRGCCQGCRRSCCERGLTGCWPLTSGPAGPGSCPGPTLCCSVLSQRCRVWMLYGAALVEEQPAYRWLCMSRLREKREEEGWIWWAAQTDMGIFIDFKTVQLRRANNNIHCNIIQLKGWILRWWQHLISLWHNAQMKLFPSQLYQTGIWVPCSEHVSCWENPQTKGLLYIVIYFLASILIPHTNLCVRFNSS